MKHEYTTKEVAKIFGLSVATITKYVRQGALKPSATKKGGRRGYIYIYDDDSIQKLAEKIGIDPMWEESGRAYSNTPEEPEEVTTVLHEWVIIQLGEMWLTDNMSLTDNMDKAKRFGTAATEAIRQHCARTGGKAMTVQTIIKEMRLNVEQEEETHSQKV